jgi:phage terminase large subunit
MTRPLALFTLILATLAPMPPAIDPAASAFAEAVRAAGNPRDQVERLLRAGIVLSPRQLQASAAARLCDLPGGPTKVGYGGARGGGKSFWAISQMGEDCLRREGLRCLLLRKVGKANRENFERLRRDVLFGVKTSYTSGTALLTFRDTGSTIRCGHFQTPSDIDAYLGLEYDVIGIEEATTLDKGKADDIATCNRTSRADWRPRMYYTTNPGNVGHGWFKQTFIKPLRARKESDTRFVQSTVYDNPCVDPDYAGKLESLSGWKRRAWLLGDWDIAAGQYFVTWRHDVHVRDDVRVELHWRVWLALDYGFRHYTAAYLFAEDGDGNVYIVDEHAERQWVVESQAAAMKAMVARHCEWDRLECVLAGGDVFNVKANGKNIADDYAANGIHLRRANMSRHDGAAEFLRRLGDVERDNAPSLFISGRCHRLIECIPGLIHDDTKPEVVKKVDCDEDGFGGDDFYDAARYGLMYAAGGPGLTVIDNPLAGWRGPTAR